MAQGPRGRIRPSPSNRDASVEALWAEVAQVMGLAAEHLKDMRLAEHWFDERNIGAIGVTCFQRFHSAMTLAVGALWQRQAEAAERLREAFSLAYWGAEILQHTWIRDRPPYNASGNHVLNRFWLHGLAAAGGATEIADWVVPYEVNVFRGTGGTGAPELELDVPFRHFVRNLMEAQVSGRWPSRIDRISMRGYGNILARVADAKAFSAALVECCDYRVMQALGYDSVDAARPRSGDRMSSVLDIGAWPKLYPLELFSVRYVCQMTTGRSLSLEVEHPLLKTPLMNVPPLLPLYEDDFIRRARAFAQDVFGTAWKPLTPIPLIPGPRLH